MNKKPKITKLSKDYRSCLRFFVFYYTNGTLQYVIDDEGLLEGIDYREDLKTAASVVETVFAIYSNNIEMDEKGEVLNHTYSMTRAAQFIRMFCSEEGEEYNVEPKFEDWETYLH